MHQRLWCQQQARSQLCLPLSRLGISHHNKTKLDPGMILLMCVQILSNTCQVTVCPVAADDVATCCPCRLWLFHSSYCIDSSSRRLLLLMPAAKLWRHKSTASCCCCSSQQCHHLHEHRTLPHHSISRLASPLKLEYNLLRSTPHLSRQINIGIQSIMVTCLG